ncbi:hypothetical protein WICMUC_002600 [Wickerhamomyces mucosus]|uniref:Uncharacterized protein n=1 Tax=Wickerhamomyces mucosus TaxID=1378264 RepID=A0A9P8TEP5_9ASCO|nr:hypothetical protein WICMUC_002600 [Wickerhamomyces mucosus]
MENSCFDYDLNSSVNSFEHQSANKIFAVAIESFEVVVVVVAAAAVVDVDVVDVVVGVGAVTDNSEPPAEVVHDVVCEVVELTVDSVIERMFVVSIHSKGFGIMSVDFGY